MTFSSDFEQLLDEYNIAVSDRTRRIIRRNEKNEEISERTKRLIRRNNEKNKEFVEQLMRNNAKQAPERGFVKFISAFWSGVYFILSLNFKITLRILGCIFWLALYLVKLAFELYCILVIVHVTTVAMKQLQSS